MRVPRPTAPVAVPAPRRLPVPRAVGAALLGWAMLVAIFTLQDAGMYAWLARRPSWHPLLLRQALGWAAWALLAPGVWRLVRRWPVRAPRLLRHLAVHGAAGAAMAAVHALLVAAIYPLFYYSPSLAAFRDVFRQRVGTALATNALVYAALAATLHALAHAREARRRQLAGARLEARAARAELQALHGQLQPHFLFNALAGVVELIETEPPRAAQMVRTLSDLLRRALAGAQAPWSTLGAELRFLEEYVAVQQMRFPELRVSVDVGDDALALPLPALALQPLVENAIRYSVGARGAGRVTVRACRVGDSLRVEIVDDGVGLAAGAALSGTRLGVAGLRARLERAYGAGFTLALREGAAGVGTVAELVVPAAAPSTASSTSTSTASSTASSALPSTPPASLPEGDAVEMAS